MLQKNDQFVGEDVEALLVKSPRRSIFKAISRSVAQILLMGLVLGLSYLATMRLVETKPAIEKKPVFPAVYTVATIRTEARSHQPMITSYGEIVAGRSVELRSLVSGVIVSVSPSLKSGGVIAKGETLLEIDRFTFEGQLREAMANAAETDGKLEEAGSRVKLEESRLQSAREQLLIAQSDMKRIEELRARGIATEKQVEDRQLVLSQRTQSVEQSEINIQAEKAKIIQLKAIADRFAWKVEQSRRDLENTRLVAPFSGTIRSSSAEVGKLANANDIQVSMYQSDNLEVSFVLTDEQYGRLQSDKDGIAGRSITILWNVGGVDHFFNGSIDRIGAEITSTRGGIEVFGTLDIDSQEARIRPGAFVEINLPDKTYEQYFKIPDSAVYNSDTVYVIENGELVERKIAIAAYDGDMVLIKEGLAANEEVLTTRISEVSAGLKVRKESDPLPSPDRNPKQKAPNAVPAEDKAS